MKRIHHLAAFCVIMPYIGVGGMPTDVQPFALFFSIISLAILHDRKTLDPTAVSIPLLVGLALATVGFFAGTGFADRNLFYDARALYGYISSFVIFIVFANYLRLAKSSAVCRIADVSMAITFLGFAMNLWGLTWVIKLFVSRAEFEWFEDQGRGLTSFYPEQSRLATQMILLIAVYYAVSGLTTWRLCLAVLIGAFSASGQFFINLSLLLIAFVISSLATVSLSSGAKLKIYSAASLVLLLFVAFAYETLYHADDLVNMGLPIRGIYAFQEVLNLNIHGLGSDLGFLYKLSGPFQGYAATRVSPFSLELSQSYYYTANPDFVRLYEDTLTQVFDARGFPYPEKAFSVFGSWLTDLKLFGLLLSGQFCYLLYRGAMRGSAKDRVMTRALFLVVLFLFLTRSNTSEPTFWGIAAAVFVAGELRRDARSSRLRSALKPGATLPVRHLLLPTQRRAT